jgi:hypothetical protein
MMGRVRDLGTHWIRGHVGPRTDLDMETKRKNPIITPVRN